MVAFLFSSYYSYLHRNEQIAALLFVEGETNYHPTRKATILLGKVQFYVFLVYVTV